MAAKKAQLKKKDGTIIYPMTTADNVYNNFGKPLTKLITAPSATITIAREGSKHSDFADYICGSDATNTLREAIISLPEQGGKIVLLDGVYIFSDVIDCTKDVIIEGMGQGTEIDVRTSGPFLRFYNSSEQYKSICIKNMSIDAIELDDNGIFCVPDQSPKIHLSLDNLNIHAGPWSIGNSQYPTLLVSSNSSNTIVNLKNILGSFSYGDITGASTVNYGSIIKGCTVKSFGCHFNINLAGTYYDTYVFHSCYGNFSGGELTGVNYIADSRTSISISDSFIECKSFHKDYGDGDSRGRLANNKIFIDNEENDTSYINFDIINGNSIRNQANTLYLNARIVSSNIIENYSSEDILYRENSCIIGNISKYSITSNPSGAKIIGNNTDSTFIII